MKSKLLTKVRSRFSIDYYPNKEGDCKFRLIDNDANKKYHSLHEILGIKLWYKTKEGALSGMMSIIRFQYQSRSVNYKRQNAKTKVWHS